MTKLSGLLCHCMDLLFHNLILSILVFEIMVWGCVNSKYLSEVDKFLKRSYKGRFLLGGILRVERHFPCDCFQLCGCTILAENDAPRTKFRLQSWKKYSWTFEKVQQNFVRLIENMAVYFNKTC